MVPKKVSVTETLALFFDGGEYTPLFKDAGRVAAASGNVGGQLAYAVCQNGEAMTVDDVDIMTKTLALAGKTGNPVVTFYASVGAVLAEGLGALAAVARLNAAAARLSGVVPQVAVVLGVCGASASLAAAGADICIMAEGGELFLTPPFLAAAAGDKTENAGTAAFAVEAGIAAIVAKDAEAAVREAAGLVARLPGNNLTLPATFEVFEPSKALNLAAYSGRAAVEALADKNSPLHLYEGFGDAVTVALATVGGVVTGFVATEGPDTTPGSYCAAKASRFVRFCDAFSIPVVTVINTGGFVASSAADAAGGIRTAARLAATYADATTAKVAVLAGRVIGPAYTAFGSADLTIALEGCVVAPVEPSAAVTVLHHDEMKEGDDSIPKATAAQVKEYEAQVASAAAAHNAGLADMLATPDTLRAQLQSALDILASKREQRLPKKHSNMSL